MGGGSQDIQVALAIYMSANAYTSWEEDPIITTVKVKSRLILKVKNSKCSSNNLPIKLGLKTENAPQPWLFQFNPIQSSNEILGLKSENASQTTALPIAALEYPAITICGQGMATDTLDRCHKITAK